MKSFAIVVGIFAASFILISTQSAWAHELDSYRFMTESNAPFNFQEDGRNKGFSVEVLGLLLQKVGAKTTTDQVSLVPWARGLRALDTKKKQVLFATARTPSRESKYKWVGPISPVTFGLIAKKSAGIKINTIQDANRYKIGSIKDTAGEKLALKAGVKMSQIERVIDNNSNLKKLDRNRIQLWTYGVQVANWIIKNNGKKPSDYEVVYKLKELDLYYAFSKDTPDSLINELQSAMDSLIKSGQVKKVVNKYQK